MRGGLRFVGLFGWALLSACGGSAPTAAAPSEGAPADAPEHSLTATPPPPPGDEQPAPEKPADKGGNKADVPAPSFKENGSVLEAINAVPQGTPRLNIDQEDLGKPLGNVELYESCKPGSSHFKAKVAVWDGKAVGLDLTTTPKNQKFADCVAGKIRGITWKDQVKSLNIVEYSY
ncbi:MAG TPA: hypothetical protein VGQ57_01855 [Polyangiaceae bacterium]|jgi:hypothetical protein|nr:hypothetical protein [Polyangiaceae bacterium]